MYGSQNQNDKNALNFPKIQNQNVTQANQRSSQNVSQLVQSSKTPNPQLSLTSQLVSPTAGGVANQQAVAAQAQGLSMNGFANNGQQQIQFNHQKRTTVSSLGLQGSHGSAFQQTMQAHQHTIGKAGPIMVPASGAQNASNQKNQRISVLSPNNKIQNSHQIVNNFLNGQEISTMAKAGHATDGAGGAQSQLSG